jgi:alpha-beta hydrolase superfamily lysophospholipase
VAAHLWPSFTQETEVLPGRLSRDLDFLKAMPDMDLIHHRMSARMFRELTEGGARAARDAAGLPYPILLVHGKDDPVTSAAATRELYDASQSADKSLVVVPEALHETHNDLGREAVLDQIVAWLAARVPGGTTGAAPAGPGATGAPRG